MPMPARLFVANTNIQEVARGKTGNDVVSVAVRIPDGQPTVFFGDELVNTTEGWPVLPGEDYAFDLQPSDVLYCVAESASTFNYLCTRSQR